MTDQPEPNPQIFWFIPSGGDGRHLGAPTRPSLIVVSGSGKFDFEGMPLANEERYELTGEWLAAYRGAFGTAFVGSPENLARALQEYRRVGVETFILSGYPHLEEAYRTAELLLPAIGRTSPIFQTVQNAVDAATARTGSATVGRFGSI